MDEHAAAEFSTEAQEAFVAFVAAIARGEPVDFETVCGEHAAVAEELRALRGMVESPRGQQDQVGLTQRIRERFGPEADPNITLEGRGEGGADENGAAGETAGLPARSTGRYRLEGEVARGGQGAIVRVWDPDLRRRLAMKVVLTQPGAAADGRTVDPRAMRRFMEEAQITGQLDHPGIVPVHELGIDDQGRVFFTMKLVKGEDLSSIFDKVKTGEEGWTQTRALRVMQKVCEAMAYSHDKGVIHRDLKPENVMVGRFGAVYVMDWGLARVVGHEDDRDLRLKSADDVLNGRIDVPDDDESSLVTMDGDIVGTPAFMPPEQARGDLRSMGPHSDVYAVGAMLYTLLAGQVPYVPPDRKVNNIEVWQAVMEGPPRPIHALADKVPAELEAICEKAMSREPADRYPNMIELADDLSAFMENRVVAAFETGALPEFRKWVQRNRGLATASAAALALLVVGLGVSLVLRARAVGAEKVAHAEANRANDAAATSGRISDFLVGLFEVVDPFHARGDTITAREILDRGVKRIEGELADEPEVQSTLMETMGKTYQNLGLYDSAQPLFERALQQRERVYGADAPPVTQSMTDLGWLLRLRAEYGPSEKLLRKALELRRKEFGDESLEVAETQHYLGVALSDSGRYAEAEPLFRAALATRRKLLGRDKKVAETLNALAIDLYRQGDEKTPEGLLREALEMRRELLGVHPDTAESLNDLALFLYETKHLDEAESLYREALAMKRKIFGDVHPEVALGLNNLALILHDKKQFDQAEAMYREALSINRKLLGDIHPNVAQAMNNLAFLLYDKGDLQGAREMSLSSLRIYREVYHDDENTEVVQAFERSRQFLVHILDKTERTDPAYPGTETDLADLLVQQKDYGEGRKRAEDALAILSDSPSAPDWETARAVSAIGAALTGLGQCEDAEPLLLEAAGVLRQAKGDAAPETQETLSRLVRVYEALGQPEKAEDYRKLVASPPGDDR